MSPIVIALRGGTTGPTQNPSTSSTGNVSGGNFDELFAQSRESTPSQQSSQGDASTHIGSLDQGTPHATSSNERATTDAAPSTPEDTASIASVLTGDASRTALQAEAPDGPMAPSASASTGTHAGKANARADKDKSAAITNANQTDGAVGLAAIAANAANISSGTTTSTGAVEERAGDEAVRATRAVTASTSSRTTAASGAIAARAANGAAASTSSRTPAVVPLAARGAESAAPLGTQLGAATPTVSNGHDASESDVTASTTNSAALNGASSTSTTKALHAQVSATDDAHGPVTSVPVPSHASTNPTASSTDALGNSTRKGVENTTEATTSSPQATTLAVSPSATTRIDALHTPTNGDSLPGVASQLVQVLSPLRQMPSGARTVTISLQPEGLGEVRVTVAATADRLVVHLDAATSSGESAIRAALPDLHDNLSSTGQQTTVLVSDARSQASMGQDSSTQDQPSTQNSSSSSRTTTTTTGGELSGSLENPTARTSSSSLLDVRI